MLVATVLSPDKFTFPPSFRVLFCLYLVMLLKFMAVLSRWSGRKCVNICIVSVFFFLSVFVLLPYLLAGQVIFY